MEGRAGTRPAIAPPPPRHHRRRATTAAPPPPRHHRRATTAALIGLIGLTDHPGPDHVDHTPESGDPGALTSMLAGDVIGYTDHGSRGTGRGARVAGRGSPVAGRGRPTTPGRA